MIINQNQKKDFTMVIDNVFCKKSLIFADEDLLCLTGGPTT